MTDMPAGMTGIQLRCMSFLLRSSVYPNLVKLAGGPEPLAKLALEKVEAGKPVEALHVTDVILAYDQNNAAALMSESRRWNI